MAPKITNILNHLRVIWKIIPQLASTVPESALPRWQTALRGVEKITWSSYPTMNTRMWNKRFCFFLVIMSVVVLLDMSKAFQIIRHDILLQKLQSVDVTSSSLEFCHSYLSGHSQRRGLKLESDWTFLVCQYCWRCCSRRIKIIFHWKVNAFWAAKAPKLVK